MYGGVGNSANFSYIGCWGNVDNIRFPTLGGGIVVPGGNGNNGNIQLGGPNNYPGNLTQNTQTAARTWSFPDLTGTVALTAGNQAWGTSTLVSGTVTVSNTNACAVSGTCRYSLTNCGKNSSSAIGTLAIGTITA